LNTIRSAKHSYMSRVIDFSLALLALVVLSPLLLIIGLAVILDSPGSPFHRGRRVGQGGRIFRMWKFRSMVMNAASLGPTITGANDPRITRVGRFLRVTKFDELPQFLNVVLGDMSLVGPRPEAPEIVAMYTPEQRAVLSVKPGVTGKVQLESREESDSIPEDAKADEYYVRHMLDRKFQTDMEYLKNRTVRGDVAILLSTALYVLRVFAKRVAMSLNHNRKPIGGKAS
jgi:lipopolysaccharide/colanic/teichoic acid biosynthesis glycosyltransferase